jgi:hypothetical protein
MKGKLKKQGEEAGRNRRRGKGLEVKEDRKGK